MEVEYKYKVASRCYTYNQASYIEETLRGFVMQETCFPVVSIIVDDASTDGEQGVIINFLKEQFQKPYREEEMDYARIICANHKTNLNCKFVVLLLKYNHYSIKKAKFPYISEWMDNAKYHALCEGDDYWTDPRKLQKQVDFLENHPDYGMCYCDYNDYNEKTNSYEPSLKGWYKGIGDLILKNYIATLTTLFRSELFYRYYEEIDPRKRGWKMADYPMWLWMEMESKIHYIDEVVAVYRTLPESASHSKDYNKRLAFIESSRDIRLFFADRYSLGEDVKKQINDVYWRERSRVLKGKDNKAYKETLRNISNKTFKEWIKSILYL